MFERIGCRNCDSPNCEGCNVYILETMLDSGKLDCLMDEHHTISTAPAIDAVEVVRCKDCKWYKTSEWMEDGEKVCKFWVDWIPTSEDDFCSYGERKDDAI